VTNELGASASGLDPSGGQYAVAVTMTKDAPGGLNIITRLQVWGAISIDEAVGLAVQEAQEINPGHQLFSIAKMRVPPCDSEGRPKGHPMTINRTKLQELCREAGGCR
jgi:hypothetical protein